MNELHEIVSQKSITTIIRIIFRILLNSSIVHKNVYSWLNTMYMLYKKPTANIPISVGYEKK